MTFIQRFQLNASAPSPSQDVRHFREYRQRVTELEEEALGHINEDEQDHMYLDGLALITPEIDSQGTRRGLSRMGSRGGSRLGPWGASSYSAYSAGRRSFSRQYSISKGYVPADRVVVHGRRLSSVLEKSRELDPSSSNIMEHIHRVRPAAADGDASQSMSHDSPLISSEQTASHVTAV